MEDYNKKTVKELKSLCKLHKIKNYSKLRKKELVNLLMNNYKPVKPFIKWVGGKTQIIKDIQEKIPNEINNYHEVFLGGGSVLFLILSMKKENKIKINGSVKAYDKNTVLINTYNHIKNNCDQLIKEINHFKQKYDQIKEFKIGKKYQKNEESKENYYYLIRDLYNNIEDKNDIKKCALFIVLNKLCFRGLYREGKNGFNVPFGHYKVTPEIINEDNLHNISTLIQEVEFVDCDYKENFIKFDDDDFVYFDPPYVPINPKSFVNYNEGGFNHQEHKKLFNKIREMKNNKFLLSNSDCDFVNKEFTKYNIDKILCKRRINSKNPDSKVYELLISN